MFGIVDDIIQFPQTTESLQICFDILQE